MLSVRLDLAPRFIASLPSSSYSMIDSSRPHSFIHSFIHSCIRPSFHPSRFPSLPRITPFFKIFVGSFLPFLLTVAVTITDTFLILSVLHCPLPFFLAYSPLSLLSLRRPASSNNSVNKAQVDNQKLRSPRSSRQDYRSHILLISLVIILL